MNVKSVPIDTINSTDYFRASLFSNGLKDTYGYNVPTTKLHISVPSECPCCNKVLADTLMPILSVNNKDWVGKEKSEPIYCETISIYRCSSCDKLFIVADKHKLEKDDKGIKTDELELDYIYPQSDNITVFSDEIKNLSIDFISNYNQAEMGEYHNLGELVGMGYRRSLEYLVDAYVKKNNPSITIPTDMALGDKIQKYISNPDVKILAQKTAWLGNDATHIVKKHPNRDFSDMKKFIKAIVKFIEFEVAVDDAKTI